MTKIENFSADSLPEVYRKIVDAVIGLVNDIEPEDRPVIQITVSWPDGTMNGVLICDKEQMDNATIEDC